MSDDTAPASTGFKPKKSVALSGVTAGNTALCTVGRSGNDLHYRGYDILDLAEACEFEEVAYLLVHGKLPNRAEFDASNGCAGCLRRSSPFSSSCRHRPTRWTCCAPGCRRWAA
jgi:citrate synthase